MPARVLVVAGPEFERTEAALLAEARRFQRRVSAAAGRGVDRAFMPALKASAEKFMPSGYGPTLAADLKLKTIVKFAGSRPGVAVEISGPTGGSKGGRDIRALEGGVLRHPLFGNKRHWYRTAVPRGFATTAMRASRPEIVHEIDEEVDAVKRDIEAVA